MSVGPHGARPCALLWKAWCKTGSLGCAGVGGRRRSKSGCLARAFRAAEVMSAEAVKNFGEMSSRVNDQCQRQHGELISVNSGVNAPLFEAVATWRIAVGAE